MKTEILLVDSDIYYSKRLIQQFEERNLATVTIVEEQDVIESLYGQDAVVLKYNPGVTEDTIALIRQTNQYIPIAVYNHFYSTEKIISLFELGIDIDLITPFNVEELILRLDRVLIRSKVIKKEPVNFQLGTLQFDYDNLRLFDSAADIYISLTVKESNLLKFLCEHSNTNVPKESLLKAVSGSDDYFASRCIDVYFSKIRKHLQLAPNVELITNRRANSVMLKVA